MEGGSQETGARGHTVFLDATEAPHDDAVGARMPRSAQEHPVRRETEVSGRREDLKLLVDNIISVAELLGLVEEGVEAAATEIHVLADEKDDERKHEEDGGQAGEQDNYVEEEQEEEEEVEDKDQEEGEEEEAAGGRRKAGKGGEGRDGAGARRAGAEEQEKEEPKWKEQGGWCLANARELQVKQEEETQMSASLHPFLSLLEALQTEVQPLNTHASREDSQLKPSIWQRRQRHLQQRSALIQGIRGFWAKAFLNHPQMSALISKPDASMLRHMTNLKVEEHKFPRECRKILLFFGKNSYFQNEVVTKDYVLGLDGYRASHSSPIQWHPRYRQEAYRRRHDNSSLNFFNWFSDHSFAGSSRIAEIIIEDLWPNPLLYFKMKEAPGERTERERGLSPVSNTPCETCEKTPKCKHQ
ncbi:testis-specific Y-encoded protein 3-like [Neofelis nebulosa]|uniref:testis-specific Y-encoded protein 3-like n=1 Tax=Neofelis nebulosa TaxID=61452 RepID=UPI00272C712C|nr:testis-specific Y-encoded protein 3-like [Neofelis nebulosa]